MLPWDITHVQQMSRRREPAIRVACRIRREIFIFAHAFVFLRITMPAWPHAQCRLAPAAPPRG